MTSIHPAVFSDNLIEPITEMLGDGRGGLLLDPCAGLGLKLMDIALKGDWIPYGVDIEHYLYADHSHGCVVQGDSTNLRPLQEGCLVDCIPSRFDGAVTSFVYPNGMADDFHAKDDSTRHTYVHRLRAAFKDPTIELRANNMARMNPRRSAKAMDRFYGIQQMIIGEVFRVLESGAPFVVNAKDTKYSAYVARTTEQLLIAGFHIEEKRKLAAHGLNHGVGHEGKAEFEELILARRPA